MAARVTIIGGGSYHWTPRLLVDFANTDVLTDAHVVLHDLDPARAQIMAALGTEIARRRGIGLRVVVEPDLGRALNGAEYVVVAISVGGFESMRHDLEVPYRYGIRQPIGDSVGPGGVMRALRSAPVLVALARAAQAECPDAWFVNVTNPLTALTRAVTRETAMRTVGLCNEWIGTTFVLSLLFGCGMHEIDGVLAGVNHFPLCTELRVDNDDGFALLRGLLDDPARTARETTWLDLDGILPYERVTTGEHWTKADVIANNLVKLELFTRFGVLPGSADHHVAEFLPGIVTEANDHGSDWKVHIYGLSGHMSDAGEDVARFEALRDATDVPVLPSGEIVAPLLAALVSGEPRTLPVNLPNAGNVGNLDDGPVVEVTGVVDGTGVRGRDAATVPGALGEYLRRVSVSQELTVEAALTGDRTTVLEAMLTDPIAGRLPYEHVVEMTDAMLSATAPWLPQFGSGRGAA